MTQINSPARSKINMAAGIQSLSNMGVYGLVHWGYIPQEAVMDALIVGNVASAAMIGTFRTWFTT
tara:strand:- start:4143 stop:4337 length:195 start_codon:yes stop_codon:yes gene_type:complete